MVCLLNTLNCVLGSRWFLGLRYHKTISNVDFVFQSLGGVSVTQSCLTLCDTKDCSLPGSSVYGFSRQEYQSGLSFPSPGDPPDPRTKPGSPALQADSLPFELPGKLFQSMPYQFVCVNQKMPMTKQPVHLLTTVRYPDN